jgi:segregation and condensation protein A
MSYQVKLDVFEGPLDLLLHLINRNELSITDIPIAIITHQYLETIELMKSLNLEVAGEYLVMAAYLTHIKSQMLLPTPEHTDEDDATGEDPRDELIAHLLEYKRYKEAAHDLGSLDLLDRDVFAREAPDEISELSKAGQPLNVDLSDLLMALRELLARSPRRDLLELQPDRLLVQDKIREIMDRLSSVQEISFDALFGTEFSRLNVLTTFLALLQLMKLQLVRTYQYAPFSPILITRRGGEDTEDKSEEVADERHTSID